MNHTNSRIPRRDILKFFAASFASTAIPSTLFSNVNATENTVVTVTAKGYGSDPNLNKEYKPGDAWPLTMTPAQQATTISFIDLLLPADDLGPSASSLRVHDYIDEWISAPYPQQANDRPVILGGIAWLEEESQKRYKKDFSSLGQVEKEAIGKDISWPDVSKPEFQTAAVFFQRLRGLAMGAYYSTQEGWKAIGYVGNVPSVNFDGPPEEVLLKLGVTQTVK
jgi:Gluconate 2-dehydrogenase subunit 3